jgi:hypothetical protein
MMTNYHGKAANTKDKNKTITDKKYQEKKPIKGKKKKKKKKKKRTKTPHRRSGEVAWRSTHVPMLRTPNHVLRRLLIRRRLIDALLGLIARRCRSIGLREIARVLLLLLLLLILSGAVLLMAG